jgi:hypothetical protein
MAFPWKCRKVNGSDSHLQLNQTHAGGLILLLTPPYHYKQHDNKSFQEMIMQAHPDVMLQSGNATKQSSIKVQLG